MVDGQIVNTKQHYYVKFHKPKGYVTAVEDAKSSCRNGFIAT